VLFHSRLPYYGVVSACSSYNKRRRRKDHGNDEDMNTVEKLLIARHCSDITVHSVGAEIHLTTVKMSART